MKNTAQPEMFDANAWIGAWPFDLRAEQTAATLARRMNTFREDAALVSHLGSILPPDPMPANRELLATTREFRFLHPLPVINPRLRIWREHLEALCLDGRVRAIRILPAWHGYALGSSGVDELVAELQRRDLRLVVTARLEDERQQFHGLSIRGLTPRALAAFGRKHATVPFLCTGLFRPEIIELSGVANLLADLAMAEWDQTIRGLLTHVADTRLCFGSLSPFLSLSANIAKVEQARVPKQSRQRIAGGNLRRFLKVGLKP